MSRKKDAGDRQQLKSYDEPLDENDRLDDPAEHVTLHGLSADEFRMIVFGLEKQAEAWADYARGCKGNALAKTKKNYEKKSKANRALADKLMQSAAVTVVP